MQKRVLGDFPPAPSAYTSDSRLVSDGGSVELHCTYERDGLMFASALRFGGVRAYKFRAESHSTQWHIQGSYDTLVEIEDSDWVKELRSSGSGGEWPSDIRHFLIYIDDSGAYELAAADVEWLPESSTA